MNLNKQEYLQKVAGCWMGKNIGGTVGAPFEWKRQVNDISFYTQNLQGEPEPNDDLDIQLLWLIAMEREGVHVDAKLLGEYWLNFVTPHWAEYGNGKINMRSGLMPPLSGSVNNDYKDSCGSFIRSEIWACVCPGAPMRAARYAIEDSAIDHGTGEGTYAEIFTVVLESAAFVENDLRKLINIGLHFIPADCAIAGAVRLVTDCFDGGMSWREAREEIMKHYRGMAAFGSYHHISQEDVDKGFFDGQIGWDAPSNIGIMVLGLLYGGDDFDKVMCITVNCGEDTDCTAATAGSIFGIMYGIDAIPEKWTKPIGRGIKTIVLNLGDLPNVPRDIDNLTCRTAEMAEKVIKAFALPLQLSDAATALDADVDGLLRPDCAPLYENWGRVVFTFDLLEAAVDYGGDPYIVEGEQKEITIYLKNRFFSQHNLDIRVFADDDVLVRPSEYGTAFIGTLSGSQVSFKLAFETVYLHSTEARAIVQITEKGRHTVMLIPIVLLNGAFRR